MRGEDVDVGEGYVAETGDGAAVVQRLADLIAGVSHQLPPLVGDSAEFALMVEEPGVDGGVVFERTVESQQFGFHRRTILAFETA